MNGIYLFFTFLIIQRGAELAVARKNERTMKQMGAIEVGEKHYYLFIVLHTAFFMSLFMETLYKQAQFTPHFAFFLWGLFVTSQLFRLWCIKSLGMYWNTKVIVLPHHKRIKTGPYMWMSHPNYTVVFIELCVIPLLVQAYATAIIFPLLHLLVLTVRIPAENRALRYMQS